MSQTIRITLEDFLAPWPELQQQYRLEHNQLALYARQGIRIPEADRRVLGDILADLADTHSQFVHAGPVKDRYERYIKHLGRLIAAAQLFKSEDHD